MASGVLLRPGTDYGPCTEPCRHTDCAATREMAAAPCVRCGDPIDYDRHFFRDDEGLAHALCVYEALDEAVDKREAQR